MIFSMEPKSLIVWEQKQNKKKTSSLDLYFVTKCLSVIIGIIGHYFQVDTEYKARAIYPGEEQELGAPAVKTELKEDKWSMKAKTKP